MKKFFIALVMCLVAMAANAQNGWTPITLDADELKGTEKNIVHFYDTGEGAIGFYQSNNVVLIVPDKGILDYDTEDYVKGVVIGLYDESGNLIEKVQTPTQRTFHISSRGHAAFCVRDEVNDKVVNYIKNKKGFVRIVADRYSRNDFDVKVPCMK